MTFSQIDKYYIDELQTNFKTAHNRFKCVTDLPNRIVDYLLDLNFLKSSFIIYSLFLFVFNLIALDVILFVAWAIRDKSIIQTWKTIYLRNLTLLDENHFSFD